MYWKKADGGYESRTLDANTGQELKLSATQGGDFFYSFHYQLYGIPYLIGRLMYGNPKLLCLDYLHSPYLYIT